MDKDIREFLDRAEQNRLYEENGNVKKNALRTRLIVRRVKLEETPLEVAQIFCVVNVSKEITNYASWLIMEEITVKGRSSELNDVLLMSKINMIGRTDLALFLYQWEDKTKNTNFNTIGTVLSV